jgi:hypothetical protein
VVSTVGAALAPAAAGAADGVRLRVRAGERWVREVRYERMARELRLACLVREGNRSAGGEDDLLRLGLELPFRRGRLSIGHLQEVEPGSGRGWSSALSARRGARRTVSSLGRAIPGASWEGAGGGIRVAAAVGRAESGRTIAGASLGGGGLEASVRAGGKRADFGASFEREAPGASWRVEAGRTAAGWRVRGGLGAGGAPIGLLVEKARGVRVAGGLRAVQGPWRGSAAEVGLESPRAVTIATVRLLRELPGWRIASELLLRSRGGAASPPRVRVTVESRVPRAAAAISASAPGTSAALRLEAGSPRSGAGVVLDLPARRGRRVAAWLARATAGGEARARIAWNRGEPVSVDLEWGRRATRRIAGSPD